MIISQNWEMYFMGSISAPGVTLTRSRNIKGIRTEIGELNIDSTLSMVSALFDFESARSKANTTPLPVPLMTAPSRNANMMSIWKRRWATMPSTTVLKSTPTNAILSEMLEYFLKIPKFRLNVPMNMTSIRASVRRKSGIIPMASTFTSSMEMYCVTMGFIATVGLNIRPRSSRKNVSGMFLFFSRLATRTPKPSNMAKYITDNDTASKAMTIFVIS